MQSCAHIGVDFLFSVSVSFQNRTTQLCKLGGSSAFDLEGYIISTVEAFRLPVEICDLSFLQGVFLQSALGPHQLERELPMRHSWQIDAHPGWLQVAPRWGAHM